MGLCARQCIRPDINSIFSTRPAPWVAYPHLGVSVSLANVKTRNHSGAKQPRNGRNRDLIGLHPMRFSVSTEEDLGRERVPAQFPHRIRLISRH